METIPVFVCAVFAGLMVTAAVIDGRTMRIPDTLVLAVLILTIAVMIFAEVTEASGVGSENMGMWSPVCVTGGQRLAGIIFGAGPMLVFALVKEGSFGGGDIKLSGAAGGFLGMEHLMWGMATAMIAAGIFGIFMIARKRAARDGHLPLGPFLGAGFTAAMFM